jgi:hypothetical protein
MKIRVLGLSGLMMLGVLCSALPSHAADKPDAKGTKMGVYIRMLNAWTNEIGELRETYFQVVDKQAGITCKERNIRMLRVAPVPQPGDDLSVKDLPKFRTAKFLGDDCKRGKEIHAMLLETWPKYFQAERDVRAAVEKYVAERDLVKLAEAEKKFGKGSFHWYEQKLLLDAKALIAAVEAAAAAPLGDAAPLHTAAAALQKTHDELKPLFQKFAARDDAGDTSAWSYMIYHASELARDSESRAKRMDDEIKKKSINPYAKGEIEKLIKTYNDMVGAANRVTFSKAMK